jgi:preprotein translocase subunit SecF
MIWGIFVATYSSIFICSPMLIYLGLRNEEADRKTEPKQELLPEPEAQPEAYVSMYDDLGDAPVPAAPAPKRAAPKQASRGGPKSGSKRNRPR